MQTLLLALNSFRTFFIFPSPCWPFNLCSSRDPMKIKDAFPYFIPLFQAFEAPYNLFNSLSQFFCGLLYRPFFRSRDQAVQFFARNQKLIRSFARFPLSNPLWYFIVFESF